MAEKEACGGGGITCRRCRLWFGCLGYWLVRRWWLGLLVGAKVVAWTIGWREGGGSDHWLVRI